MTHSLPEHIETGTEYVALSNGDIEGGDTWKCSGCNQITSTEYGKCLFCDRRRPRISVQLGRQPSVCKETDEGKKKRLKGEEGDRRIRYRRDSRHIDIIGPANDYGHKRERIGMEIDDSQERTKPSNENRRIVAKEEEGLHVEPLVLLSRMEGQPLSIKQRIEVINQRKARRLEAIEKQPLAKIQSTNQCKPSLAPSNLITLPTMIKPTDTADEVKSNPKPVGMKVMPTPQDSNSIIGQKLDERTAFRSVTPNPIPSLAPPVSSIAPPVPPPTQTSIPSPFLTNKHGTQWTMLLPGVYQEIQPNGGGSLIHIFLDEAWDQMDSNEKSQCVNGYIKEMLREEEGLAIHCMGIIHGGVLSMPNLLSHIADYDPHLKIMSEDLHTAIGSTMTISEYINNIQSSYNYGTHQAGPMRPISLVGTVKEETGGYFESVIQILESNPLIKASLPWGSTSTLTGMKPNESDDGPILWTRPGEQVIRLNDKRSHGDDVEAVGTSTGSTRVRVMRNVRERIVKDRTNCHADFSGHIPERAAAVAVGLVQSCDPTGGGPPIECKHVVCFRANDMKAVQAFCQLRFEQEPMDQTSDKHFWMSTAKLNSIRRTGVGYIETRLMTGDLYFIPRKVVHQFQTIAACTSVAWHLRYANSEDIAAGELKRETV